MYRHKNGEKIKTFQEKYYKENKESLLTRHRLYYQNNKNDISKKAKEYRENNIDNIVYVKKEYYENNKDKILKKAKEYRIKNKEKILSFLKEYRKTYNYKISKRNSENKRRTLTKSGDVTTIQLRELIEGAKKCYWCESKINKKDYHIDHFVPLSKGGSHTISNLVIACPKCNLKKNAKDPYQFAISVGKLC